MSITLASTIGAPLLSDNFSADSSLNTTIWSSPITFIPSTFGSSAPGTELATVPTIVSGALHLLLQTYNPTNMTPGGTFEGSQIASNSSFNTSVSGIAFTAVAKLGNTVPGMVGGIFPYVVNSPMSHDEIDVELLSEFAASQPSQAQTNIYLNAPPNSMGNPAFAPDPALTSYQTYTMEWFPNEVLWFIDGNLVAQSIEDVPQGSMQFYLNAWAYNPTSQLQPVTDAMDSKSYDFDVQSASVSEIVEPGTTVAASGTVVGVGANFLTFGAVDNFIRNFIAGQIGQLSVESFNSLGTLASTESLTDPGGDNFTIEPTATVAGTALNFLGNGLGNIFVIATTDQLMDQGFTAGGVDTWTQPLTDGAGVPFTVDPSATVAGTALNFLGNDLDNIFIVGANGQLVDQGFTNAGIDTWTQPLTDGGGVPFLVAPGTTIGGTAPNFLGNGLDNVFVLHAGGQVVDEGFTNAGADTWTQPLTEGPGVSFTMDPAETIAGTAPNFLGNGLENLFVIHDNGQLVDEGFTTAGVDTWTQPLTVSGGGAFTIAATNSVAGVGRNYLASGGYDLFLRGESGQLSVAEFSHSGAQTGGTTFVALGNGDSGQVLIGTTGNDSLTASSGASTLIGDGGSDTYGFGTGATQAVIVNGTTGNVAASGTLNITAVNTDTGVWLDRVNDSGAVSSTGNNLRIDILGTSNSMTVDNWFTAGDVNAQLVDIVLPNAAGSALKLDSGVANLVQAMATYEAGYATSHGFAFDPTNPANAPITDATVLAAVNADWHH